MKINETIVKCDLEHFNIGKICRWKDFVFVFDVTNPGMAQLSTSFDVIGRLELKKVKQIDSVFFNENILIIADSMNKKIYQWEVKEEKKNIVTLSSYAHYPLPTGSIIAAFGKMGNDYVLLDKGLSMIRTCDPDFNEIRTVGSRMGYIREYEEEGKQRLGFEFPEDMVIIGNHVLVSDSGNKRLVVINEKWQQEKTVTLPEFPYKILYWNDDQLVVSDFDRSLMFISLKYGFVHQQEIHYPVDFFPSVYRQNQPLSLVGSEKDELVELSFPPVSCESIAETANNWNVLMKIKVDKQKIDQARKIAAAHKELLPEYAKSTTDDFFNDQLSDYINESIPAAFKENETVKNEISTLSVEFTGKYKAIPGSEDNEAANIDKENTRHRMFLKIKEYRKNLKKLVDIRNAVKNHSSPAKLLEELLSKRFETVKKSILTRLQEIETDLSPFKEQNLLAAVVDYWLLSEEEKVLFKHRGFTYEKLFGDTFLLAILNNFYYSIAELFLKRHKSEEYIAFSDREITMYPDKTGIAVRFIKQLMVLNKYDDALRMLGKFPDRNKENVNYLYYRVYLVKGDTDKAFFHLKKELDLYSHRFNLIPQLIRLNKLDHEQVDTYINKILEKAGQSIDIYLSAAAAFLAGGNVEKAVTYVEKELEFFPENQQAIAFKLNRLLNRADTKEMEELVPRLTSPRFSLVRSKVYFFLEDYEKSWNHFKNFIRTNPDKTTAGMNLFLVSSLNHLCLNPSEILWLQDMVNRVMFETYKQEFLVYLSFLKHAGKKNGGKEIEKFDVETYLSSYSTAVLAYHHFIDRLKLLKEEQKWEELFQLAEKILKYNPGAEKVFEFLKF